MTGQQSRVEAFADASSGRSELDRVAGSVTSAATDAPGGEMLIVAVRPLADDRRVVASAGTTAIRAAVSVSIAAGNTRAWSRAGAGGIADVELNELPEILRAAVQPSGIVSIQIAVVSDHDRIACLTMWLSRSPVISPESGARHRAAVEQLTAAVEFDRRRDELAAQTAAAEAAAQAVIAARSPRVVVPLLDAFDNAISVEAFEVLLGKLDSDQLAVIALSIDDRQRLAASDAAIVDREVAGRLAASCRSNDVIALVGNGTFAVLLADIDRRTAFDVAKRLRSQVSQPVDTESGLAEITLSVGLAHESGLVDPLELFGSARAALSDATQAGGARMLVAS
jgi:GGDEF domain-containing protein